MQGFLITLLTCSVTMSALALFYMAVTRILEKRYSVTACYYAWLVIVMGLMIPFRPHFHNAIVKVDMPVSTAAPVIQTGNAADGTAPAVHAFPSAFPDISWWQAAAAFWLAGMLLFLAYHGFRHYRFLKLTKRWSKRITDKQTLELMQSLKTQMGLTGHIGLKICDSIGSPMITGFAKPCIQLPKADFTKEDLIFILKHELVHYRRRDLWYKCLVLFATAVHWFNPIVYLMAKAIDIQCELSCDEEVIRGTDTDTRQAYIMAMIGVVRKHSKRKTALSTNFYGGKKGMKKRIFSIMDRSKKKAGLAIPIGILILTFVTGFAFNAKAETPDSPEMIKKDIVVSPHSSNAYRFLPDPEVYAKYSSYGITISDDGKILRYNGQKVRLFVDERSDTEAFFLDETGIIDLSVIRNDAGRITGIEKISEDKAQEYRTAFFGDEPNTANNPKDSAEQNKYEQYSAYNITLSADGKALNYNGRRVKLFVDELLDGSFEAFWNDEAGTVSLSAVRDSYGQITAIERISKETAQEYLSAAEQQYDLSKLEEKIENKLKAIYPEN